MMPLPLYMFDIIFYLSLGAFLLECKANAVRGFSTERGIPIGMHAVLSAECVPVGMRFMLQIFYVQFVFLSSHIFFLFFILFCSLSLFLLSTSYNLRQSYTALFPLGNIAR